MTEIKVLRSMKPPTANRITDRFGTMRLWGSTGWYPNSAYSPLHWGIDYSARGDAGVYAPVDGQVWGEFVGGAVGSCTSFIPHIDGKPTKHVIAYLIHCKPTGKQWLAVTAGDRITEHAGYGIGAPHLHWEVCVTPELARTLVADGLIDDTPVDDWIEKKARVAGIGAFAAARRVEKQRRTHGITAVYRHAMVRAGLPKYRLSRHSGVGRGETWALDMDALAA